MRFATVIDDRDLLGWGYADNDLVPCGIYDIMTNKVTLYEPIDQLTGNKNLETIRQFAVEYMKQICQYVSLHDR